MLKKANYKASVLVANYNNEKHLSQCVESILKQSYRNIETIVLDDNSNDKSLDVLKKYENKIVLLKKSEPKTNIASFDQAKSYHECLKIASGEIIFFVTVTIFLQKIKLKR